MEGYKPMAGGLGVGGRFGFGATTATTATSYTGGLFGYSSPAASYPAPISYFSPPVMTASTSHLFSGTGGSYPYAGGRVAPRKT